MARYPIEVAFETRTVQLLVDEERAHAIVFVDAVPVGRARIATGAQGLDLDAPARARLLARHLDPRRVARETADRVWVEMVPFHVQFRPLSRTQIEAYLDREQPWNCAGSFKSEGLGVALFQRMEGEDPSALVGLPLIRLVSLLAEAGVEVLTPVGVA